MSSVDERIVKMVFDNADFAKKVTSTISSLTQLNKATDNLTNSNGLNAMGEAFHKAEVTSTQAGFHIRDVWLKAASILEYQVAGKIVNAGKQIANAMTFEGIADGFKEYELKMGSVQTILAGTGESLETVNKYLEELNAYSDKTIYSFADMTNNIGKFTNAGVKLEDAVGAIKGIANEAARSGANANEASRAMYNFSQALSAGYVKLIDWKSIENANMATKEFKDTLLEVATAVGTVEKGEDGMYKVLSKNANGATMKETISATKNFNDSLAYQWMTTDVLTKTMNIYATDIRDMTEAEKAAYEQDLRSMGMSDEQIKKFEELGSAATDAASEVKTFSMLIDTLKEAIGSGWAQTWEIIIGDFEEAKELWTEVSNVLGGFIDRTSDARNNLLKGWDMLQGRAVLIDAIKRAFEALVAVVRAVGDGFKYIFPPVTAKNLYNISKAIQRFAANLMLSDKSLIQIRQAAGGFFAVLNIGLQFVKSFVKAILPAGNGVKSLGSFLLEGAANLCKFLMKLNRTITQTQLFDKVFANIKDKLAPFINAAKKGLGTLLDLIKLTFSSFSEAATSVGDSGTIFEKTMKTMSKGVELFKAQMDKLGGVFEWMKSQMDRLKPLMDSFKKILSNIGTYIGSVFKQLGDAFNKGNGISAMTNLFNALISGGILLKLYTGFKNFSSLGSTIKGTFEGVNKTMSGFGKSVDNLFGSLGKAIDSFGGKVGAETLLNVAKAVAILAGSLVLVSMVDSDKLLTSTGAIVAMVASLSGAMVLLMKAASAFSNTNLKKSFSLFGKEIFGANTAKMIEMSVILGSVAKALIAMGGAVLMMSVGLKIVSKAAEGGHLWESFAVISLMLVELTGVALVLSKFGGDKAVKGLMGLTSALVVMAAALKIVSNIVAGGNAWESLGILSIMLAELAGVVMLVQNFGQYKMTGMLSLISLAVSLNLCVIALKQVSDALGNDGNKIWQSLGIISIMLAELAGITILMSQFGGMAALGGVGALMAAQSLLMMTKALLQINDALGQADQHVWQSLGVIAGSLAILAIGLTAMTSTIGGATALLIASVALIALGSALKIMGEMSLSEVGKGLLAVAGALVVLAAGLTLMILALPGAIALGVAAAGLIVLAMALKMFGSMSLSELITSLTMLGQALGIIALMSTVFSVVSPLILVFAASIAVFGLSLMSTGVGLTMFAAGLQALVAVAPMGAAALKEFGTVILELIPVAVEALMESLAIISTKIVQYGPEFQQCASFLIDQLLTVLGGASVKFAELIVQLIVQILDVITAHVADIAEAGTNMIIAFWQAITDEIPRIVDAAYKCAIALINGLADAIEANNSDLIDAVDHLMNAVIQAITQWLVEFTPLGLLIPENMKSGIEDGSFNVKDALDNLIKDVVDAIKKKYDDFKQAAAYLLQGLKEGLENTPIVGQVVKAAEWLGNKVVGGLTSKKGLDENSPSVRAAEAGAYFVTGLKNGITENADEAVQASEDMGNGVAEVLLDPLANGAKDATDSLGVLADGIKDLDTSSSGYADAAKKLIGGITNTTDATKVNTKAIEDNKKANKDRGGTTDEIIRATQNATKETKDNTDAVNANTTAQDKNATATGKGSKAAKKSADVMDYASGVVEAFTKKYGDLYKELGEDAPVKVATVAVRNLAEETYKASLKTKQATEENEKSKATIEDMIKSFTEMKEKIYDSVKSYFEGDSFFQKFEVKTEMTMKTLLENMKSNIDGVTNWSNKLSELADKGLSQGFLKHLAELGPKGFEYVNAFSTATAEEIQQANQMFEQAATLPDSISNNTLASYAKAGLNCVEGFKNGIDQNTASATLSMENLGTTCLTTLQETLEEHSPSKATYRDGEYLIQGLNNGMRENSFMPIRTITVICEDICKTVSKYLSKEKFFGYGQNVAYGLAEGMSSDDALNAVRAAADRISEIAEAAIRKYNEIKSPSRLYRRYGGYIAEGLAMGMTDGTSTVQNGAYMLSEAIKNTLDVVESIAEDDMTIHPVIEPVLDLASLRRNASLIGGLFPAQSLAMASSIGIGQYDTTSSGNAQNEPVGPAQINFTQNNYSPKELNRYEIYRQTKNQLNMMKGVVRANA